MDKPVIAITIGDPAGIGPEIVVKAMGHGEVHRWCRPLVVGSVPVVEAAARTWGGGLAVRAVADPGDAVFRRDVLNVLPVDTVPLDDWQPGRISAGCGLAMLAYTERAVDLALAGQAAAVLAGPHTKKSVELAGVPFHGYPGLVAARTGTDPDGVFLMLVSDRLRIAHVTDHVPLREAVGLLHEERILRALRATGRALERMGWANPTIGVAGLNPHAGEGGLLGEEESIVIRPAVERAAAEGLRVVGPVGADVLFAEAARGSYDGCLAMYHDQGHIPIKVLGFDDGSAFTIGTPVLFATVAHGSALDIAGQGVASPRALLCTLRRLSALGTRETG